MQKTMLIIVILALGFLALWVFRDKPPDFEAENAREALEAARAVEAHKYASEIYNVAYDTFYVANVLQEYQDKAFVFFRNYGEAKRLYIKAEELANKAQVDIEAKKEQIETEIPNLLDKAHRLIDSTYSALQEERRSGKGRWEGKGIHNEISLEVLKFLTKPEDLKGRLLSAVIAYDNGDYATAKIEAEAVIETIKSMKPKPSRKAEMNKIDRILDQIDTMKSR